MRSYAAIDPVSAEKLFSSEEMNEEPDASASATFTRVRVSSHISSTWRAIS